jgi:DNA-binding winged helix-turn-helix (wHTH) protein
MTKSVSKPVPKTPRPRVKTRVAKASGKTVATLQNWLQLAQLRSEKCELKEARIAFQMALTQAKKAGELRAMMEALAGLLRLAAEALDEEAVEQWDTELDALMTAHPRQVPPLAWHCKGAVASYHKDNLLAQRFFHRYLKAVRKDPKNACFSQALTQEELEAKGWMLLAITLGNRGRSRRAQWLAEQILTQYEEKNLRGINGITYLLLGSIAERNKQYDVSLKWFQKAHGSFLGEHNWYYHLYVLYGYARLSRHQQNYAQAYWYLDLMDKAACGPEFGLLRREISAERSRLADDAVDLLIDSRKGVIKTRSSQIQVRKQYVLLDILEALSNAHGRDGADTERGLSKAEIIERVWNESYRPEAHDNKLYYNINRLRKLIEPDIRKPQYLLNWKEGYRLAPGLRIQFIGGRSGIQGESNS